jgi:hypothetical protein
MTNKLDQQTNEMRKAWVAALTKNVDDTVPFFDTLAALDFDEWLREIREQAWLAGYQAGEEDVIYHEVTSYDSPCLKSSKNPYEKVSK